MYYRIKAVRWLDQIALGILLVCLVTIVQSFFVDTVAAQRDFLDYINNEDPYDYENVLILGVTADWRREIELADKYDFDVIIPISRDGDLVEDAARATLAKLGITTGTLAQLKGKNIRNLYAHSWGSSRAINSIEMEGDIKAKNLFAIGSPHSTISSLGDIIDRGLVKRVYFHVNEEDLIAAFRHIPSGLQAKYNGKIEFHFYKTERSETDTEYKEAFNIPLFNAPLGFDCYYHYNSPAVGHGLESYFANFSFVLNRDPEYSSFGKDAPFYAIPSYWTYVNRPKSVTEAHVMTGLAPYAKKALIVGDGAEAEIMYKKMVEKLGEGNVKWIKSKMEGEKLQDEAKNFGAEVILGVHGSEQEETDEDPEDDDDDRRNKGDGNGNDDPPGGPGGDTLGESDGGDDDPPSGGGPGGGGGGGGDDNGNDDNNNDDDGDDNNDDNDDNDDDGNDNDDNDNDNDNNKGDKVDDDENDDPQSGVESNNGDDGGQWPDNHGYATASYEGAAERVKEARRRSHEINKARNPGAYGFPGKPGAYIPSTQAATSGINIPRPIAPIQRSVSPVPGNIGGVMLHGAARVSDGKGYDSQVTGGTFSLIFRNSDIETEELRKFVTALWAVYFSQEGPGISIDPIAPGVDKHLVRYIGNVINSDLGRVMRESDYLMKKWAVGTERPEIEGFGSVDALSAKHGIRYLGASRRFWFVPEDMRFKRSADALLFDSGEMTLKTEYVFLNKTQKAEPSDIAFAEFFTEHYNEIADEYPVYSELYEYAKLVSLARYLKEQGIPMLWFLLANKDMVITEDSPGTVDALAKKSDYSEYIKIEGGVDLASGTSPGSYVIDRQATQAVNKAIELYGAHLVKPPSTSRSETITVDVDDEDLTFASCQALTHSHGTVLGDRYQTDFALRQNGEPGLELVRHYNPELEHLAGFGKGWHLMVPYHVEPHGHKMVEFLNITIPEKMAVRNLLMSSEEILTFSQERYSIAGYVPDNPEASKLIGLFILSDASYRLADKLGNEFQFDQSGYLTEMVFSEKHCVSFGYGYAESSVNSSYFVKLADEEYVDFHNFIVPRRMKVIDSAAGKEEILALDETDKLGYLIYRSACDGENRDAALIVMADGSFVLSDKDGNETFFDPSGAFKGNRVRVIDRLSHGDCEARFDYEFDAGRARVKTAHISWKAESDECYTLNYEYGNDGRLCRVVGPAEQAMKISYGVNMVSLAKG